MNPHCVLMQLLASRGWFVISANYRKGKWPEQLDDSLAALRWAAGKEAAGLGADALRLVVSGASAGGHIAALLTLLARSEPRLSLAALVLFYPALDPGDATGVTARSPLGISALRLASGQSLLHWFFEWVILGGDAALWPSASVLDKLQAQDQQAANSWPPTLIAHGECDSVVPIEHSRHFLALVAAAQFGGSVGGETSVVRSGDLLLTVPGGRHTYDIVACEEAETVFRGISAWLDMTVQPC